MFLYLVIICFIYKSNGKHSLFLQVCFVNASKTLSENNTDIQETWFHSCMFTTGTFSIIFFRYYNRRYVFGLIHLSSTRDSSISISRTIPHFIRFTIKSIDCSHQHIIRDIFQMSAKTKPWSCHRNMVSGTLSLSFDQQRHIKQVASIPGRKRSQ